ncbi:MAG: hypothetical protein IJ379_11880 [Lachnospiraceae bacterium]|nr:hypothetical protein [Lachnospiraceae bacterium]
MQEKRSSFFNVMMRVLDNAEGARDTTYGPFSFLWDNSYVKKAVVSSFETNTSITGLKMFLAKNVLKMYTDRNRGKEEKKGGDISLSQLTAIVNETATAHKYYIDYTILDDCIDIEKNKKAMLEKMHAPIDGADMIKYIEESNTWFPYIFMDRLRDEVWHWLREFFKLCDQKTCSNCVNKSLVYFKFIQAVALYEIFYIELVQEYAAEYTEQVLNILQRLGSVNRLADGLEKDDLNQKMGKLSQIKGILEEIQDIFNEDKEEFPEKRIYKASVFQLLVIEFAISLHAMCDLLMIFEAMHVCEPSMRGMTHLSLEIGKRLDKVFEKELATLENSNAKRYKRYREVNLKLEEMQKNQFPYQENLDIATTIYCFMEELCKPVGMRNRKLLRGYEVLLAYPVYRGADSFGKKE